MVVEMTLAMITLLLIKHIVADYFMQYSWMIRDKGTYGAWGGIAHSGWHGILTLLVLYQFFIPWYLLILLPLFDFIIHYHVDYVISNFWKSRNLVPADQMYWVTHGVDQLLHLLTYIAITWIVSLCV